MEENAQHDGHEDPSEDPLDPERYVSRVGTRHDRPVSPTRSSAAPTPVRGQTGWIETLGENLLTLPIAVTDFCDRALIW